MHMHSQLGHSYMTVSEERVQLLTKTLTLPANYSKAARSHKHIYMQHLKSAL